MRSEIWQISRKVDFGRPAGTKVSRQRCAASCTPKHTGLEALSAKSPKTGQQTDKILVATKSLLENVIDKTRASKPDTRVS